MKFLPRRFGLLPVAAGGLLFTSQVLGIAMGGEFDAGSVLHFSSEEWVGTYAFDMERIYGRQNQLIRHEATEYQRKVAEARVRAYMAAQSRAQRELPPKRPGKPEASTPKPKKIQKHLDENVAKPKLPRFVAVDTVKDARSSPATKKVVMIWDTQSESFVNNYVYDVVKAPAVGETEKFETYSAQYIGAGPKFPKPPGQ